MTPEQFLKERFPHLRPWEHSIALKAIEGERMPLSPIDEQPLAQSIKDEWRRYSGES